jgi:crotonobetainyl-CoA:carnitine CoA-transferase CaiB-like acyl-CoA transferase
MTAEVLRKRSSAEWLERLDAEQVPCGRINRKADVLTDPQVLANNLIVESEHPHAGKMRQARPAARFEGTPSELLRQPAPRLGEQTDVILAELGVSAQKLAELHAAGTIA